MKYTVWQNYSLNLDDWRDDLVDNLVENGYDESDITEDLLYNEMVEHNDYYFDDERSNLSTVKINEPIVEIANIGLWDGRRTGIGKDRLSSLSDCLKFHTDCEYAEFYVEDGEFKSRQSHHDGTHYITYRKYKEGITEDEMDAFEDEVYHGILDNIDKYTEPLGQSVANVYGWDLNKSESEEEAER